MLVTISTHLEGYKVVQQLGVVRGIIVRSRNVFGSIGASIQTLFGGNITLFTELCDKTRQEAFNLMLQNAKQAGANAIIKMLTAMAYKCAMPPLTGRAGNQSLISSDRAKYIKKVSIKETYNFICCYKKHKTRRIKQRTFYTSCSSYEPTGSQVQIRFLSPYVLLILDTAGQNLLCVT